MCEKYKDTLKSSMVTGEGEGTGIVAKSVKLPSTVLVSNRSADLSPGCSTSGPAWEGRRRWSKFLGSCTKPWLLQSFGD